MAKVQVRETIEIAVPAARAWALLGDFGGNHRWMPAVASSELHGTGLGATRRLAMDGGGYVDERLVACDEAGMTYRYEMFGGTVPVKDYVSDLRVEATDGGCRVHWNASFEPVPDAPIDALALVREVYRSSLANARVVLETP